MSNLNLPALTFDSLETLMTNRHGNMIDGKTIAYATTCQRGTGNFVILHHGSPIAVISRDEVQVTCAGWTSLTTLARVSAVLRDNHTGVYACRRNWCACFAFHIDGAEKLVNMDTRGWYRFAVGNANLPSDISVSA